MKLPKCLVNGQHTPGSEWERECPLNLTRAEDRRAVKARRAQVATPAQRAARAAAGERFRKARQNGPDVAALPISIVRAP